MLSLFETLMISEEKRFSNSCRVGRIDKICLYYNYLEKSRSLHFGQCIKVIENRLDEIEARSSTNGDKEN